MDEFDVVVIGAGPGGYVAAIRASQLGLKSAIIDKQWLGGVCLNIGCIPSKALLKNAEVARTLRERGKEFGFSFQNLQLDYISAVKRSRQVSDRLTRGVGYLLKKNNVRILMGSARLKSKDTLILSDSDGREQIIKSKNIIIATGSQPASFPGAILDGENVITYREAILQEKLPKSVVIIGAGPIGLEFATIWSSYGSEITIVEMLPHIAPLEDEEVSNELQRSFSKRGINILTGSRVQKVESKSNGVRVWVASIEGEKVLDAEQALVAIGFKPNSLDLGLEEIGVEFTGQKHIKIDDYMSTNIPGIWAIGDVTGKLLLAHVASTQGIHCVESIAGKQTRPINYAMIPRAIYSQPQVASLGFTEAQARESGESISIGKFPLQANGKALGSGDSIGFIKIIVDKKFGEILGAHMIGAEVSELLPELTLAQQNELTITEVIQNIHTHPTLSEAILEAAENSQGIAIHI